jgi:hypothetical protein
MEEYKFCSLSLSVVSRSFKITIENANNGLNPDFYPVRTAAMRAVNWTKLFLTVSQKWPHYIAHIEAKSLFFSH